MQYEQQQPDEPRSHRAQKMSDAEWNRRFEKFVDPFYYVGLRRGHAVSVLNGGTYTTKRPRVAPKKAAT